MKSANLVLVFFMTLITGCVSTQNASDDDTKWVLNKKEYRSSPLASYNLQGSGSVLYPLVNSARYTFSEQTRFYDNLEELPRINIGPQYIQNLNKRFDLKDWIAGFKYSGQRLEICYYSEKDKNSGFKPIVFVAENRKKAVAFPIDELFDIHPFHPFLLIGPPISQCPGTLAEAKSLVSRNFAGKLLSDVFYPKDLERQQEQFKKQREFEIAEARKLQEEKRKKDDEIQRKSRLKWEAAEKAQDKLLARLNNIPIPVSAIKKAQESGISFTKDTKVVIRNRLFVPDIWEVISEQFGYVFLTNREWHLIHPDAPNSIVRKNALGLLDDEVNLGLTGFVHEYSKKCSKFITDPVPYEFTEVVSETRTDNLGYQDVSKSYYNTRLILRREFANYANNRNSRLKAETGENWITFYLGRGAYGAINKELMVMQSIFKGYECNSPLIKQIEENYLRGISHRNSLQADRAKGQLVAVNFSGGRAFGSGPIANFFYSSLPINSTIPTFDAYFELANAIYDARFVEDFPDDKPEAIILTFAFQSTKRGDLWAAGAGTFPALRQAAYGYQLSSDAYEITGSVIATKENPSLLICSYVDEDPLYFWYNKQPVGTSKAELRAKHPANPYLEVRGVRNSCPIKR